MDINYTQIACLNLFLNCSSNMLKKDAICSVKIESKIKILRSYFN